MNTQKDGMTLFDPGSLAFLDLLFPIRESPNCRLFWWLGPSRFDLICNGAKVCYAVETLE